MTWVQFWLIGAFIYDAGEGEDDKRMHFCAAAALVTWLYGMVF